MKSLIFFLLLLFSAAIANAQWVVYTGNGMVIGERVLYAVQGRIFPGDLRVAPQPLYTVIGNEIMVGGSGSMFDLIYTERAGKLYRGNAMYSSQIAYTFADGRIYRGDSQFPLDVLCSVQGNMIFEGAYANPAEGRFVIEGPASISDLFAILLALGLLD